MRILVACDHFPPQVVGGAEISAFELALEFQRGGHDVRLFTTSAEMKREEQGHKLTQYEGLDRYVSRSAYPHRLRHYVALWHPSVLRDLRWVLDDYRPDVVHFHNIHEHISYRAISQTARSGVPSVITLRDCMSFDYGQYDGGVDPSDLSAAPAIRHKARPREQLRERRFRYNPFRNLVIRRELAKASARVTISRELERAVNANGILGTQVIPNGLDPVRYQWSDGAVAAFRRRHELDEREVIFWSGRVYPKKGAWQALKALQHIVAARPRALLLVAARQTDHMMHFLKASSEMDLTKHVQVTGWLEREELIAAYRASSVVIFPSIYLEAFGRVPLEAMACERPTVVTCFGGPPEVVEDGVTGYVVNPFDHRLFAERILHLLTDVDLADRMGRAGRVRFERHFKIDAIASRYISLFADAGATSTHHAAVS